MKIKKHIALLLCLAIFMSVAGIVPATAYAKTFNREQYYLDAVAEYAQFDDTDPGYITDEEFYGVWDENANDWKDGVKPYLYYENFPELAAVEAAAKVGNYQKCKEEILSYYREKHRSYNIDRTVSGNVPSRTLARYETGMDNLFRQGYSNIMGKAFFEADVTRTNTDMTSDLKAIAAGSNAEKLLKFMMVAGKKDGYRVEIKNSGDDRPVLETVINGKRELHYPETATYIDGTEPDTTHNSEEKLLIEESVSSIGNETGIDENTKCAFLQFRFPDLRSTDQVESATLYLNGNFVEDDVPDSPRVDNVEFKSIYFFEWDASMVDPNLTYNKYTLLARLYTNLDGEPGLRLLKADSSNKNNPCILKTTDIASYSTNGYLATGNEAFAYQAIRLFVQDVRTTGNYEQLMEDYLANKKVALWIAEYGFNGTWIIDKLMESRYMTADAFNIILKFFHMIGRWGEANWPKHFNGNNHGSYGVNCLETICFLYPEFRAVYGPLLTNEDGSLYLMDETLEGSVRGGWMEVANYRRAFKAGSDIFEDGSNIEGSTSYALEGMGNYLEALEVGEKLNIDVRENYNNEKANAKMEKGLMYVISKLNPMMGDFQVGDCAAWTEHYGARLRRYTQIIDNPFLEYVVTNRERGKMPTFLTCAYDDTSTAVFRDSWADDYAIAAHFESRGGSSHNHIDDGNIVLFAYGNYLLVDPRMGDYNANDPYERWVSSTRGHNTVEINNTIARGNRDYASQQEPLVFAYGDDGQPKIDENGVVMKDDPMTVPINTVYQQQGYLYPEDREINTVYDFIRAKSLGYTNHNQMKEDFDVERDVLFLRSGYFIVTDNLSPEYGAANGENHYKQLWHFLPDANMSVDTEKNTMRTNFNGKANIVVATVKNNENMTAQYKYGLYAAEASNFGIAKYGTFEQDKLETATFNTLLYPLKKGENADITTSKLELDLPDDEANAFKATVVDEESKRKKEISFYTLYEQSKKAPIGFGEYETDGTLALADTLDTACVNAVIRRGSYLKNIITDEYMVYSEEEIEDIGVSWQLDEIDIAYNTEDTYNSEIDLTKLTIKTNGNVSTVRLNGEEISFAKKGRYIYFGDTPIIDDEEILPNPDDSNAGDTSEDTSHGSAGNGSSGSSGGGGGGNFSGNNNADTDKPIIVQKPSDAYSEQLKGHWAETEITQLIDKNIVQGADNGELNLDKNITRAEFITMLVRAFDAQKHSYSGNFSDVNSDDWYADYIETALKNGWVQGDGAILAPNRSITREEAAKIIVSAYQQKLGEIESHEENAFSDCNDISPWAKEYVNKALSAGLINGMGDGTFMPRDNAKREQAMVLIYRLLNRIQSA